LIGDLIGKPVGFLINIILGYKGLIGRNTLTYQ